MCVIHTVWKPSPCEQQQINTHAKYHDNFHQIMKINKLKEREGRYAGEGSLHSSVYLVDSITGKGMIFIAVGEKEGRMECHCFYLEYQNNFVSVIISIH